MSHKSKKSDEEAKSIKTGQKKKQKSSTVDRIQDLEDELKKTKYNKATQHHVGLVKAKLAMLKEKQQARRGIGKSEQGYSVRKSGDATVILLGFPSCGKSSLLNAITNANSPVGNFEFTTLDVIPGVMDYNSAKIQVLDVPGIVQGAASGRGRGKEVLAVMFNADLVLILVDVLRPDVYKVIQKEVYDSHIRLNQEKPDVRIRKTSKDGIRIGKTVRLPELTDETITAICKEMRINNAEILIRSKIDADQFIDMIEGNKKYIPGIVVLNKIDLVDDVRLMQIKRNIKPDLCISAEQKINLIELKELIFQKLNFIRIFCKECGKKADLDVPLIMKRGTTIEDMCNKLHRDFITKFKYANVWGKSAKFPGQRLMLHHVLEDGDIVEIHLT